jgi:hypothetical protein
VLNADGSVKNKGLDNHAMGTIFEELVRRFNEENNEEAGEHWTHLNVTSSGRRWIESLYSNVFRAERELRLSGPQR